LKEIVGANIIFKSINVPANAWFMHNFETKRWRHAALELHVTCFWKCIAANKEIEGRMAVAAMLTRTTPMAIGS